MILLISTKQGLSLTRERTGGGKVAGFPPIFNLKGKEK
jgi:hypothetical protein